MQINNLARPFILSETNWKEMKETKINVAILPWGATEAHNFHLPYGTDNFESEYISAAASEYAWNKGAKVIVLPVIPFGVNTGQMKINMTINMNPSTQFLVLKDICESLSAHKVNKLVIINSHGGNDFKQMIRELYSTHPKLLITLIDWYKAKEIKNYFNNPGDHAGEMETSMMMEIAPQLLLPLASAGDGKENHFKLKGLRDGLAWTPREWTMTTNDTGVGNPKDATRNKGKLFLDFLTEKIGEFILELENVNAGDLYEKTS